MSTDNYKSTYMKVLKTPEEKGLTGRPRLKNGKIKLL